LPERWEIDRNVTRKCRDFGPSIDERHEAATAEPPALMDIRLFVQAQSADGR
jgi:hypothetical protein